MPLVANTQLPSFTRIQQEGGVVIPLVQAERQDVRELHVGLLNMMPDKALEATERQFFRLIGESNQIAQFYLHPFTLPEIVRSKAGRHHVDTYYQDFDEIKRDGLDALIITGANVTGNDLSAQPFSQPLCEIIDWAYKHVTSTLCSCLATHAVLGSRYRQKRIPLKEKCWGVFSHRITDAKHPLVAGINTRFDVPHSRFNEIRRKQFVDAGIKVLAESEEAGVHLAVSPDGFRIVFFQGHPEYDAISLLKEYKREIGRYIAGEIADYPPFPEQYFSLRSHAILREFAGRVRYTKAQSKTPEPFPEGLIVPSLDNTWHDSAEAMINNWIGQVYQITHIDRHKPFSDAINPEDPLGLLT